MPDEKVDKWKQEGRVYLWRYLQNTRNYPGWHLSADQAFGRRFGDLIQIMLNSPYNSQKALTITAPTKEILSVPNNQGGRSAWESPKSFVIKHQKAENFNDLANLEESSETVVLTAGRQQLGLLGNCVSKILEGDNDYAIEIGDTQLWFW
jgi:hypothetical protein